MGIGTEIEQKRNKIGKNSFIFAFVPCGALYFCINIVKYGKFTKTLFLYEMNP